MAGSPTDNEDVLICTIAFFTCKPFLADHSSGHIYLLLSAKLFLHSDSLPCTKHMQKDPLERLEF
jgi:hypothetical protein